MPLHIAGQIIMLLAGVKIQVEPIALRAVRRIKVGKYAAPPPAAGQAFNQKEKRIQIGDVYPVALPAKFKDPCRQVFPVETGIYFSTPGLFVPPNGAGSGKHTRAIATIQVESGKTELKGIAIAAAGVNALLPAPFGDVQRDGLNSRGKPFRFGQGGIPECGNARIPVVQVYFRHHFRFEQTQSRSGAAGKGFKVRTPG